MREIFYPAIFVVRNWQSIPNRKSLAACLAMLTLTAGYVGIRLGTFLTRSSSWGMTLLGLAVLIGAGALWVISLSGVYYVLYASSGFTPVLAHGRARRWLGLTGQLRQMIQTLKLPDGMPDDIPDVPEALERLWSVAHRFYETFSNDRQRYQWGYDQVSDFLEKYADYSKLPRNRDSLKFHLAEMKTEADRLFAQLFIEVDMATK